ncbi:MULTISPECIES: hypothetical protein [unclassified Cellulomonas]|uniref:hypothetical protein n=1 Tax=unclassified Cellulomonas TaxID=2620175 RepID=UPI0019966BA2|nr:hypothetical protein [Cellulomonas sp. ES6]MBD3778835.1 hypothetical protein [Micrococcales bacterium]WHP19038.1 hypothetical protein P9841_08005 [Cellulomonas sp. ES6]
MTALTEGSAVDGYADPGTGAGGGHRGQDEREAAWARALAEMESVADRAEALLRAARSPEVAAGLDVAVTEPWRTPRGLGPLPLDLAPRAAALVERQRDLVRRTAEQLGEHRRSLRLAESMRTRPAAVPVYLDAEA